MELSGTITLDSSSFLMNSETNSSDSFYVERVSISSGSNNITRIFNNAHVINLTLIGEYKIIINSTGPVILPRMGSQHNYFSIQIPAGFNMSMMLSPQRVSSTEILVNNHSAINAIQVSNGSTIKFYGIRADSSMDKPVSVLLKSPLITVNGETSFGTANFHFIGYPKPGVPLDINGHLQAKLDFVDNYIQPLLDGTRTQFVTYLQSLTIDGRIAQNQMNLEYWLPGDISSRPIQLINILLSNSNIILLLSIGSSKSLW